MSILRFVRLLKTANPERVAVEPDPADGRRCSTSGCSAQTAGDRCCECAPIAAAITGTRHSATVAAAHAALITLAATGRLALPGLLPEGITCSCGTMALPGQLACSPKCRGMAQAAGVQLVRIENVTLPATAWRRLRKLKESTVRARVARGASLLDALRTDARPRRSRKTAEGDPQEASTIFAAIAGIVGAQSTDAQ